MSYIMHIGFDNSHRLNRNVYYFEYKNLRFKLIQNDCKRWCDELVTIIDNRNNKSAMNEAYSKASEFLSALCWEHNSRVKTWNLGGIGSATKFKLKNLKSSFRSYPRTPFGGLIVGYDINTIPDVQTQEQKNALLLFRDASSSNHDYLSFLFYWQILEINCKDPVGWINKNLKKNPNQIRLTTSELTRLPLNGKTIGNYLLDDCRHAIAHFKRKPGKVQLKLDTTEDNERISMSVRVIRELARFYIENNLKLNERLHLVRKNGKGFPFYANNNYLNQVYCKIAYKKLTFQEIKKRKGIIINIADEKFVTYVTLGGNLDKVLTTTKRNNIF